MRSESDFLSVRRKVRSLVSLSGGNQPCRLFTSHCSLGYGIAPDICVHQIPCIGKTAAVARERGLAGTFLATGEGFVDAAGSPNLPQASAAAPFRSENNGGPIRGPYQIKNIGSVERQTLWLSSR